MFPKSRNSNRFVQSRYSHISFNPYGSCASVVPSYVDPLVLAEDFALAEVEILYPPPIEEGTDPSLINSLIVKFKNTNVLTIRKATGDMVLRKTKKEKMMLYFCRFSVQAVGKRSPLNWF
jgi:hypothetical protein